MTIGREYLRISDERHGKSRSPEEQHADNEEAAREQGWTLGEPYREANGTSASRYSSAPRAAFDRLSADIAGGRFGAQVLMLWESSRGSRRVGEWVELIEACEDAGVRIHVTTHDRTYNPANARDRKSLLEDAVDSEFESGKSSRRIRRSAASQAAAGKPHGRIPYGYAREYSYERDADGKMRKQITQTVCEPEAAVVRELYERLREGHSLHAIERDYAARGLRTRTGKPLTARLLGDWALRPAYAGLRIHEPANRTGRYRGSLDGAVEATWPTLVSRDTYFAVRALLLNPARRTSRPGRAKHLLSLIAACGVCGGPLTVFYRRHEDHRRLYECRDGSHVRIGADDLDAYAEAVMLAYLARPDVIAELRVGKETGPELARVRGELAAARAELTALRDATGAGKLSVASLVAAEPGLLAAVQRAEHRERELATPPALAGMITPGRDVARRWKAAPMTARREVTRLLCSPQILGTLRVDRSPVPGHTGPVADRVTFTRDV